MDTDQTKWNVVLRQAVIRVKPDYFALSETEHEYYRLHSEFPFSRFTATWASWHVMQGTSLQELMELGGWKSYEMVLRYAHLAPEHLADAATRIEKPLETVTQKVTISPR